MKRQLVDIREGLYVVQYSGAADAINPPSVAVVSVRGQSPAIEIMMPPGTYGDKLDQPGTSLVLSSEGSGQIAVVVTPSRSGGSVAAEVSVMALKDLITRALDNLPANGKFPARGGSGAVPRAPARRKPRIVNIMHISGQGDVQIDPTLWMPQVDSDIPIEGMALGIEDPGLAGAVEYRVRVSGPKGRMSSWARNGIFVGSRGRSLPLTGIGLRLTAPDADRFVIHAEARFIGGATVRLSGPEVYLSGPTGYEGLLALKVEAEARFAPAREERAASRPAYEVQARTAPSRVRVFRKDTA
jgi:hypothetical protein